MLLYGSQRSSWSAQRWFRMRRLPAVAVAVEGPVLAAECMLALAVFTPAADVTMQDVRFVRSQVIPFGAASLTVRRQSGRPRQAPPTTAAMAAGGSIKATARNTCPDQYQDQY